MKKLVFLFLAGLSLSRAQTVSVQEATAAQVTAGTAGAGYYISPRRLAGASGLVSSVTGTANQITASPTTGAVSLSLPTTLIGPGTASFTQLGVGTGPTAPATMFQVIDSGTSSPRGITDDQYNTGTNSAQFNVRKARGTFASPTTIVTGDILGRFLAWGHDGTQFVESGNLRFTSSGTIGTNRIPSQFEIWTSTNAAPSVLTQAVVVDSSQNMQIVGSTGLTFNTSGAGINGPSGGSVKFSSGSVTIAASGTNQNVGVTPSGTGNAVFTLGTGGTTGRIIAAKTSSVGVREGIFHATVSDAGNDAFDIYNATITDGRFSSGFSGSCFSSASSAPLVFVGQTISANDSGAIPMIIIQGRLTDSQTDPNNGNLSNVLTRPLIGFAKGDGTYYAFCSAAGNLILSTSATDDGTNKLQVSGDIATTTAGKTLKVKSGANSLAGTVALSSGSATITSTAIDTNTVIVFSLKTSSGTPGLYQPLATVGSGSATVTGAITDNSTYNWVALKVN